MNIGLLFGSFNPVHCGHMMIANYCLEYTHLQEIWFVVSPQNPLKDSVTLFPVDTRLQWLQTSIGNYDLPFRICDLELSLPVPSYTIVTLAKLAELYAQHNFSLIMGADNIAKIEQWQSWQEIILRYTIFVYPRGSIDAQTLCRRYGARFVDAPVIDISSSMLRRALAQGRNLCTFLPQGVNLAIQNS
jgi:nicotinate-nucleotide adenylyltransferase